MAHPLVWFITDKAGRYPQIMSKFALNDLHCDLFLVPSDPDAVIDTIRDVHATCVKEGATNLVCPTEPITYTSLVNTLKEKKLFPSIPPEEPTNRLDLQASKEHAEKVLF